MNVFILEEGVEHEGTYFVGVYSSNEKAKEKVEDILNKRYEGRYEATALYYKEDERNNFFITEYVVDGLAVEDTTCEKN